MPSAPPLAPAAPRRNSRTIAALIGVAALGFALRIWLAHGQLWLDEIWSLGFVWSVHWPWDVWRIAHDNNHPLNTLWMRWIGDSDSALPYRALSIASGTLAVFLAARIGSRAGRFAGLAAALLVASSTLLAYYSSEARGYAPAVACMLGAWLALERALESGSWRSTALWWVLVGLGLSSHLTFVFGWAALAAASLLALLRDGRDRPLLRFARLQAVPVGLIALTYFGFVRGMAYGGGPEWSWADLWRCGMTWTFGLPESTGFALLGSALLALAFALEFRRVPSGAMPRWLVFACVTLVPPLLTALVFRPQYVAIRYFIIPLACAEVLVAQALGRLASRGAFARSGAFALLVLFAALNLARAANFASIGRGDYRQALEYIVEHTQAPQVRVSSDLEFDTRLTVEYHVRALPPGHSIRWFESGKAPPEGLDWMIMTHSPQPNPPHLEWLGHAYEFDRVFEAAGPSSYTWSLYRRAQ